MATSCSDNNTKSAKQILSSNQHGTRLSKPIGFDQDRFIWKNWGINESLNERGIRAFLSPPKTKRRHYIWPSLQYNPLEVVVVAMS